MTRQDTSQRDGLIENKAKEVLNILCGLNYEQMGRVINVVFGVIDLAYGKSPSAEEMNKTLERTA